MPILGNQPPGRPQGENKWEFKGNNNGLKQFKGNNNGLKRPLLATLGLRLTPPGVQSREPRSKVTAERKNGGIFRSLIWPEFRS